MLAHKLIDAQRGADPLQTPRFTILATSCNQNPENKSDFIKKVYCPSNRSGAALLYERDPRCLRLNLEIVVKVFDQEFVGFLLNHFDRIRSLSAEESLASVDGGRLPAKIRDATAWLFSPYLSMAREHREQEKCKDRYSEN